ncbi:hypothetical protein PPERSA_12737 [Pseudocohnilembus persalinus]|uniref:Cytidyltransferase-like domain-containing protein n=1 Tax=Pseudocohnilembus persalinus TaxID=266149 RepID=A0A0V0QTN9_PSEPJ|nr:hypothetical protein PPERSA_12737 [Pseudocohnilembus persalinus]|eukprot:KRX05559.1 hypothetical protein PPERSA_12737 [Pseudocohnilembus persalinus]
MQLISKQSQILIEKIIKSNHKLVLYVTGCGAKALHEFTQYPGSSSFAQEAKCVYGMGSTILENNLQEPEKYVSQQLANNLAINALKQSHKITYTEQQIINKKTEVQQWEQSIGLGLTGSIKSAQPKKGKHQCYITAIKTNKIVSIHLDLEKDTRTRDEEDELISFKVWQLVSYLSDPTFDFQQIVESNIKQNDKLTVLQNEDLTPQYFLNQLGNLQNLTFFAPQIFALSLNHYKSIMLSGSFNPLHEAHLQMLEKAAKTLNLPKQQQYLEMAIKNADKGEIDYSEVKKRIDQVFQTDNNLQLIVSCKSLFIEKTQFLHDSHMILGIDTLKRLVDKKYYGNCDEQKLITLSEFVRKGIKFFTFPRFNEEKQQVEKMEHYIQTIPKFIHELTEEFQDFRNDISSTAIRQKQKEQIQQQPDK